MKKINKIVQIVALVASISSAIIDYIHGNNSASLAWGCCAIWITNLLVVESILKKAESLNEELKKLNQD